MNDLISFKQCNDFKIKTIVANYHKNGKIPFNAMYHITIFILGFIQR